MGGGYFSLLFCFNCPSLGKSYRLIYLYSGTPGSGKSLDTARVIFADLSRSHPVICNFPINLDLIKNKDLFTYVDNSDLTPDYLVKKSQEFFKAQPKEGSITLVIDEAQMLFNCRNWDSKDRNMWCSFFTQHRKYGYDIILVAQFDRMLDRQIRSLIEYEIVHRKVNNFGWKGIFIRFLFFTRTLFVRVKVWYPMKEKIDSSFFKCKKKYFQLYDTFNTFSAS